MADILLYVLKINLAAAAVIFLTAVLSRHLAGRYSVRWKYRIWLALAILLLLPVQIPETWNIVHVNIPAAFTVRTDQLRTARETDTGNYRTIAETDGTGQTGLPLSGAGNTSQEILSQSSPDLQNTGNLVAPAGDVQWISMETAADLAAAVWAAGVLFLGIRKTVETYLAGKALRRWNLPNWNQPLERTYRKICGSMKLKRTPRLMLNSRLTTPLLMGFLHPCICIPQIGYTPEEQELILFHELCHYQRKDLWYKLLLNILCIVHWFNPALWWMKKEADRDLEFLCDESVMERRAVQERMLYNRLLAKTAAGKTSAPGITTGFSDSLRNLKKRMANIMRAGTMKKGNVVTACFLALFVLCNALTGCSVADSSGSSPAADEKKTEADSGQEPAGRQIPDTQEDQRQLLDTVPLDPQDGENRGVSSEEAEPQGQENGDSGSSSETQEDDGADVQAPADTQPPARTPSVQPTQTPGEPADMPQEDPSPTDSPQESAPSPPEIELTDYVHDNLVQEFAEDMGMEQVSGQMFGENGYRYENSYAGIEWQYVDETIYGGEDFDSKYNYIGSVWCEGNTEISVYGVACGMNMDEVRENMQADGWKVLGAHQNAFLLDENSGYDREYVQFETDGTTITQWYWCNWPEGDL